MGFENLANPFLITLVSGIEFEFVFCLLSEGVAAKEGRFKFVADETEDNTDEDLELSGAVADGLESGGMMRLWAVGIAAFTVDARLCFPIFAMV